MRAAEHACLRKVRYALLCRAHTAHQRLRTTAPARTLRIYQCGVCHGYHLTRSAPRRGRA